jgi:hypothetical protein
VYLVLVEDIGHEEEELHSCETFAEALPLPHRERDQLLDMLQVTILIEEALRFEDLRVREDLNE